MKFFAGCLLLFLSFAVFSQEDFSIGETRELGSLVLDETRTLNIYLPPGYRNRQESDTAAYPVIYLLDGSADEDFLHVAGLLQFCNFPWVGQEPEAIIVGIGNNDRERDFHLSNHYC